jgi:hypothetical protein
MAQHVDPDELLPIGGFSKRSSLSIHQLRHYHEVGLLEPRWVDSESGYRGRCGVRTYSSKYAPGC